METSSSSGIAVNSECIDVFQSLKIGKKVKYIIYKLSDDKKSIVVEKQSAAGSYDEFTSDLPSDDCRYAVFDFEYKVADGDRNKIVFYAWSPESATIKSKMIYSSSKEALRKTLTGVAVEIQGTDFDEVSHEAVQEKINRV
ncbi:cofilin [Mortierella alpina]|uniref:Cofilin n=1 Tax=Mortierella alpina TaxID=64518 RepID=A0A9P6IZ07_MORAP|nr:cofilin [Mortierella alpina]